MMPSNIASHSTRRFFYECTALVLSVDWVLCAGYVVIFVCILATTDKWCPLPVAADLAIAFLVPLAFNLGFHRRTVKNQKTSVSVQEDLQQMNKDEITQDSEFETLKASLNFTFAKDKNSVTRHRIASASFDGSLRIWHSSGKCEQVLDGSSDAALYSVSFSPDGKCIATGACDGTVIVWVAETGAKLYTFDDCGGIVCSVAFSPCSTMLLTGTDDHCVQLWVLNGSQEHPHAAFEGHIAAVSSVAFSPCGAFVASGSHDATARIWNVASGECQQVLEGHDAEVLAIAYSPYCNMVATSSQDGTMRLWSAGAGWCIRIFEGHEAAVRSVAFSRCGNFLCTGSADGTAKLWNAQEGMCKMTFRSLAPSLAVHGVAFSIDGDTITTAQGNIACVWNVRTGACLSQLEGHNDIVHAVAMSD
mmetsp:Transcript_105071/g.165868  ORF Transcript_105071/g.165868 Transcript_105071/m.165868 type:complete len:418 (-) Transcript_105071:207-1460(-)|eukprot:CAMPEP_0169231946 /NCGR_PEP_ID=MMETSP1016-20121227/26797_1 /TAXON_ID=342587 /ORGANISM="Karlodinium micrum, Strain CCMP2283" /LENGTH=417 /DNA_ID=CAMNT_0009311143 /DNA_START=31 /DNA_END=1284 /DNA_ORIENTATION=-